MFSWLRYFRRFALVASVLGGLAITLLIGAITLLFYFPEPGLVKPIADGVNLTRDLNRYRSENGFDEMRLDADFEAVRDRLRDTTVLIVPSWLADQVIDFRRTSLVDYFSAQEAWLESQGITVHFAGVQTEESISVNARWLEHFVRGAAKPVCFVTHSKGGLDVLEFLINATPSARDKVACWIAFQAPFGGAPLADWASDREATRFLIGPTLRLLGGDIASLDELRTDIRHAYVLRHQEDIARLAREIPILAVATRLDPAGYPLLPEHLVEWALNQINGSGVETDGIVPTASSVLPHAPYVVLDGLDHGMTVGSRPIGPETDVVPLLQALLIVAHGLDTDSPQTAIR